MTDAMPEKTLGVIAGSGDLPRHLIESCRKTGRPLFVIAIEQETDPDILTELPHLWIKLGAIGPALERLKAAGAQELVLAGKINRPSFSSLSLDKAGAKLISRLGLSFFGGDAAIFKTIVQFLEAEGFRMIGVQEVLQNLRAPEGPLGQHLPNAQAQRDIEMGAQLARAIGMFDVGQAVIVRNGLVLGVEAVEGTDALIARCAAFHTEGKGGVLVKARKPIQEERVDLPTIGMQTVEAVHQAGFSGIAVEAGHALIVGKREVIRLADALGLFVIGFSLD
jgi:DUF1009 family protein